MTAANIVKFPELKVATPDFEVDFEIEIPEWRQSSEYEAKINAFKSKIADIDQKMATNEERLSELNKDIDRLTNHADGLDYLVAVGSGTIAALIDSFWVGDFSLKRGRKWGSEKTNQFVMKVAKWQGYKGEDIKGAIEHLEKNFPLASDSNTKDFGGSLQHHLRDFSHHPTIVGLFFSMLTQFTGKAYGTDNNGVLKVEEVRNKLFIGDTLPKKLLYGIIFWFFHIVSDMAGSSNTPGSGTGLPGPILSLLKEISALPFFKNLKVGDHSFSVWLSKLFNGTLLGKRDENGKLIEPLRFDLRAEIGVGYELGRQSIPVIVNECLVRGFYFIRHFMQELKEKEIQSIKELHRMEFKKILPFKNRTIVRMLTISTGTFTAIDLGDAAIRSGIESGFRGPMFWKGFLLKVNFVGLGRFTISVGTDVLMGAKQHKRRDERMSLLSEQLHYANAKVFFSQAAMWTSAERTEDAINGALEQMERTTDYFIKITQANKKSMQNISKYKKEMETINPTLIDEMLDTLQWGS